MNFAKCHCVSLGFIIPEKPADDFLARKQFHYQTSVSIFSYVRSVDFQIFLEHHPNKAHVRSVHFLKENFVVSHPEELFSVLTLHLFLRVADFEAECAEASFFRYLAHAILERIEEFVIAWNAIDVLPDSEEKFVHEKKHVSNQFLPVLVVVGFSANAHPRNFLKSLCRKHARSVFFDCLEDRKMFFLVFEIERILHEPESLVCHVV